MDMVTIMFSIAIGATLASLSSVLLNLIKNFRSNKKDEAQVIIKKGGRTVEILTLSHTEVDRWLRDFKSDQQDNTAASGATHR